MARKQEAKMTLLTLLFFAWEKFSGYKLCTKRKRESRNFALRVLSPQKNLAREKKRDFSGSQVFFPFFLFVLLLFCESEERRRRRSPTVIIPISPRPFSLAAPPFWAIGEMGMGIEAEGQFGSLVNHGIPGRVESSIVSVSSFCKLF